MATLLAGCGGAQSALAPAGLEGERVAALIGWLATGGGLIWAVVVGASVAAVRRRAAMSEPSARQLIVVGGVLFPTVVLAVLLYYGLYLMSELRQGPAQRQVAISGERFWWRIRYLDGMAGAPAAADSPPSAPSGPALFETANELRLPVGEITELLLTSPDVIHSFWVPALAGKMDLVPGHVTRLYVQPTRVGRYRGSCAEFCGAGHALMGMEVVVMERAAFDAWLAAQQRPSVDDSAAARLFVARGCGGCHTVRGTQADGRIGPDLTHIGSRRLLGAAVAPATAANLARFIRGPQAMKPGAQMPPFGMLPAPEIEMLAQWLAGLK